MTRSEFRPTISPGTGFEVGRLGWELEVAQNRLAAAHASRFWKLRDAWFAMKRATGLSDEP